MTITFPQQYQIGLQWKSGREGTLSSPPRPELLGGAPPEFGGSDKVWSPEHLLLSSASLCLMLTFIALAEKAKLKIHSYRCRAEGTLDKTEQGIAFTRIFLRVELRAHEQQRAEAMLQTAKKYCVISNSLKAPFVVDIVKVGEIAKTAHLRTVDEQNEATKTNEQADEGGGYARSRANDVPGEERPNRGGS